MWLGLRERASTMTTLMKVEITKREIIKPSSPTPPHLRNFKLSFLDQLSPVVYNPVVLVYTTDGDEDQRVKSAERTQRLKKSLSETLTRFYPLAGRIKDNNVIDCNDDGVEYLETRVNRRLSDVLELPEAEALISFHPFDVASTGGLLFVQTTFFECGGMTVGVRISHKITDAASLTMFIMGWATTAHEYCGEVVVPVFNAASLFPPVASSIKLPVITMKKRKFITRRYVFDASKISVLKTKAASDSVRQPTRVEAVSALIWKCAIKASRSNLGFVRPSLLSQPVNLRKRMAPPLPDNSFGNLVDHYVVETAKSEIELHGLVGLLRNGIVDFSNNYVKKIQGDEWLLAVRESYKKAENLPKREDLDFYVFTSWCRFPIYEADFGWGKPTWASVGSSLLRNVVKLIDTRDGEGIEVWVTLSEEDMAFFQRDEELLAFASLNPSAIN